MLFNSHIFVFLFLPVVLTGFVVLSRIKPKFALYWILSASLVFYGWWSIPFLGLLILWIVITYLIGQKITSTYSQGGAKASRPWAVIGICANLFGLGYFKYAVFFTQTLSSLTGFDLAIGAVILPLAISFHTFQQIAYLADLQRGENPRYGLAEYMLFVSFFPQLIAGPIVHHYELLPQIRDPKNFAFQPDRFSEGISFFVLGLVKKVAIADPLSTFAEPVFATASAAPPGLAEAWFALIAFSLGLYFDFSAYSDMAIGLARMFGLRLPYNFDSPYKSRSIIEFWRRWHMTLSRFLRDYLYIPLGGNRLGSLRRSANLMVTMLLGGLWHGAAWTFVIWGGLHGMFLLVNHAWNGYCAAQKRQGRQIELTPAVSQGLTLLAVLVAWAFFAAPDAVSAFRVIEGMFGLNGLLRPETADYLRQSSLFVAGWQNVLNDSGFPGLISQIYAAAVYLLAAGLVLFAPNTQEIVDGGRLNLAAWLKRLRLRYSSGTVAGIVTGALFLFSTTMISDVREFVYFQF